MVHRLFIGLTLFSALGGACAQVQPEGFLCCNMRSDGSWISDINYFSGTHVVPAGTPLKVTGYGRYRIYVEFAGNIERKQQAIGNDYSRSVKMEEFALRYVVPDNPNARLASYPPKVRQAIEAARVTRGMTREQVLMAVGYPIASETTDLGAPLWRYWTSRSGEYQVFWGEDGRVDKIFGAPATRALVELE